LDLLDFAGALSVDAGAVPFARANAVDLTKERWEITGKIPTYADLDVAIKQERPLWYRRLHSQSSQAILEELWQSYKSWFALRKKGDKRPNRPVSGGKPTCRL
jgi:hypothetical protein